MLLWQHLKVYALIPLFGRVPTPNVLLMGSIAVIFPGVGATEKSYFCGLSRRWSLWAIFFLVEVRFYAAKRPFVHTNVTYGCCPLSRSE